MNLVDCSSMYLKEFFFFFLAWSFSLSPCLLFTMTIHICKVCLSTYLIKWHCLFVGTNFYPGWICQLSQECIGCWHEVWKHRYSLITALININYLFQVTKLSPFHHLCSVILFFFFSLQNQVVYYSNLCLMFLTHIRIPRRWVCRWRGLVWSL